ncbi:MAG TPA: hypothetical protein PKA60_02505 [Candidatus Paceibacterota bacterium]|nr:hypothetical protein [Candidatus Paceibacterota bacterium]
MNIKDYIQSQSFKGVLIGIFIAIIALIIFQSGVAVGERRASFAHRFGDNFERNFRDPRGGFFQQRMPSGMNIPGGHGAVGEIVSISLPLVVVAGPDNLEKTVVVGNDTEIREFRDSITADKLEVGSFVVVLGTPNDEGQIDAKLVRILPPPPESEHPGMKMKIR